MADVTLLVMADDNPVADDEKRWRRGEIVDVFTLEQCPGPAGHPRHLHIHITGIPFAFAKIKAVLTRAHVDDDSVDEPVVRARRKWCIDAASIPVGARNALVADREITVPWTQVKNYIKRRLAQARTLDANLADGDLDG